jgi:hypothetical protein
MNTRTLLRWIILLALLTGLTGVAYAQAPELVENTTITPNPVVQGGTVYIYSELTYNTPNATVRLCVPADWTNQATLNGLTPTSTLGEGWSAGAAAPATTINGVSVICADYATTTAAVGFDAVEWSFAVSGSAAIGASRPVRVWLTAGNLTNPPLQTLFVSVQSAVTTVYASDDPACGGNGTPGVSCFTSLADAFNVASASQVIVVGDLTLPAAGFSWGAQNAVTLRGIGGATLKAASACSGVLLVGKAGATVSDLAVDGAACPAGTGVSVSAASVTLSNLDVSGFTAGAGVASSVAGLTAKNNFISNNSTGLSVTGANPDVYGNRVVGNGVTQMTCGGGSGAAFNWLGGGTPPTFGAANAPACTDATSQLGSNFVNWVDGTALNEMAVTGGAGVAVFDLGTNPPFGVGTIAGLQNQTSNYYAVKGAGTANISTFGMQYKLNPGACASISDPNCWSSSGASAAPGHFIKGNTDPTAITLTDFTAASSARWTSLAAGLALLGLVLGGLALARRRIPA